MPRNVYDERLHLFAVGGHGRVMCNFFLVNSQEFLVRLFFCIIVILFIGGRKRPGTTG